MSKIAPGASPADAARTGLLLYLGAVLCFGALDALAKWLSRELPVLEVVWGRYLFGLLVVLPWLARRDAVLLLRSAKPGTQVARAVFLAVATLLFFAAVSRMQLADVVAIGFLAPLLVVALSALIFGERVGPRRWTAVALGFLAVLVILRPGLGVVTPAALAALGVPFCNSAYHLATKQLSSVDPPATTLVWTGVVGTAMFSVAVPVVWIWPSGVGWLAMIAMGAFAALGHGCLILAYRHVTPSALAPYMYLSLPWVTLLGFVFFGDLPDPFTVIGAAGLIASGIYVYYRERQLRRLGRL
jgi:drug/metabolite transporter (DMT)-like permease